MSEVSVLDEQAVATLSDVREAFQRWLYLTENDVDVIDIVLATVVANRLPGERLWLFIVEAPGGGKTEILRSLRGLPETYFLSNLTEKTLISGYRSEKNPGRDPSLLPRLDKKVLIVKDFTPVMDKPAKEQRRIFGDLRDQYDGFTDAGFGNIGQVNYEVSFGFLAGVTTAIDRPRAVAEQELGDRYLKFRFHVQDTEPAVRRAAANSGSELEMRKELASTVRKFLGGLVVPMEFPKPPEDEIVRIATFCATMRTPVARDRNHELVQQPRPEVATRLVKQFSQLIVSLAVLRGRTAATPEDLLTAWRVAADTAPPDRLRVFRALQGMTIAVSPDEMSSLLYLPRTTCRRILEDLWILRVVDKPGSQNDGHEEYALRECWKSVPQSEGEGCTPSFR